MKIRTAIFLGILSLFFVKVADAKKNQKTSASVTIKRSLVNGGDSTISQEPEGVKDGAYAPQSPEEQMHEKRRIVAERSVSHRVATFAKNHKVLLGGTAVVLTAAAVAVVLIYPAAVTSVAGAASGAASWAWNMASSWLGTAAATTAEAEAVATAAISSTATTATAEIVATTIERTVGTKILISIMHGPLAPFVALSLFL